MLAKYREAFTPSRAKDDPTDAELALDLLVRHRERFQPLQPQSEPNAHPGSTWSNSGAGWSMTKFAIPTAWASR